MKLTFVMSGMVMSGGARVIFEYANHLKSRGHKVSVVYPLIPLRSGTKFYRLDKLAKAAAVIVRRTTGSGNNGGWFDLKADLKMIPTLHSRFIPDADIVVATKWATAYYVASYPQSKGKRFYLIQDFDHYFGPQQMVEATWKLALSKITGSRWLYEKVVSVAGDQDIINIPDGIDHKSFRKVENINSRSRRIAMMYSTAKYKRVGDGIQALEVSKAKYPNLLVTIFGPSSLPRQIRSWVEYRPNAPEVELVNIYNQASIFICSSLAEGFALPPAEAMACGCAIVSTDCGGNREYAEDGVTALLSPPKNPEALAKNVIRLLENDDLRIRLAIAGHERIQKFTWEKATDQLERVFLESLGRSQQVTDEPT